MKNFSPYFEKLFSIFVFIILGKLKHYAYGQPNAVEGKVTDRPNKNFSTHF